MFVHHTQPIIYGACVMICVYAALRVCVCAVRRAFVMSRACGVRDASLLPFGVVVLP